MNLIIALAISLGINLVMFIPAFIWQTDQLTDISYAVTFATVGLVEFFMHGFSVPKLILLMMVLIWAVRLGSYLLVRIRKIGKDSRFDGMREHFFSFLKFWILQGVTVFVILIPLVYFMNTQSQGVGIVSVIGIICWLLGLVIESFADAQKFAFMNNPANKDRWIENGVWNYSRHPNYLGEMMIWIGVYLFVVTSFTTVQALISLVSPLYIIGLLLFVSGIPLLEKSADNKWGTDPNYQAYKQRTSVLFLWPHKKVQK